ncbi:MAG: DEAD/DEAH box helicase [Candidatus Limiplasma sp.]|nr:DEAD/DEAH box helicase [Candidatus Limiplasma sp.]
MMLKTSLYPHQQAAVNKLLPLRVGALYMEMGTGKTRTVLELIHLRKAAGKLSRVLWLCPCSTRGSLAREIAKHAQQLGGLIRIEGIESLSASVRLTSELLALVEQPDVMLVVDESNLTKNHRAIRTERITLLAQRCRYRMILNGTPVSQCEKDLFAQWCILDWRILGYRSFYTFAANHLQYDPSRPGRVVRTLNVDYLTQRIAPYAFQITREECLTLPPKAYQTIPCRLALAQRDHYIEIAETMLGWLDDQQPSTIYRMFSALQEIISGRYVTVDRKTMRHEPMFPDWRDNPRLTALLDAAGTGADQVLIYAKYTHDIADMQNALSSIASPDQIVQFHGGLRRAEREAALQRFTTGGARFMLANKTCAGYGLNLQCCHHVIYYSNDWDYATRIQSEDRVHRMGQAHPVTVQDLFATGTLDERILRCLRRKENIVDSFRTRMHTGRDSVLQWIGGATDGEGLPEWAERL